MTKKLIALMNALCLCVPLFTGCGSGTTSTGSTTTSPNGTTGTTASSTPTPAQVAMSTYASHTVPIGKLAEVGAVKIDGRTITSGSGIIFEWTASGFVMEGELEGDVVATINSFSSEAFRVWVDGEDACVLAMEDGIHSYTLAEGLTKGKHTVRVAKTTEAYSRATIRDISFTGKLSAVKASERKIEFFGDSITAGTDLFLDAVPPMKKQDGTRTYAALTADALGADYHVMALGGFGCMGGSSGDWCTLPPLFERASYAFSSEKWDATKWQPDVVVVNLGTNDWSYMHDYDKNNVLWFEDAAKNYLKKIRSAYPNAHIIWAYGMMGNPLEESLQKVINNLNSSDAKIYYLALPVTVRGSTVHPGYEDSENSSAVLIEYIKQITGWQ